MSDAIAWLLMALMLFIGGLSGVGVALDRFGFGASAAALAALVGTDPPTQLWWFFAGSATALIVMRRRRQTRDRA